MPSYVVAKVADALNEAGKPLKGSRVLVLGLSYKPNVDDDRESPSYEILELLQERGAEIGYCDPYFPRTHPTRRHDLGLESAPVTAEAFRQYDALVVSTAHDAFRDPHLYEDVPLVVDTRNLLADVSVSSARPLRVVKA
jgi:UDP-N-acetyl-D-glucosamine dehydrogenase